jgi:hypothetical protein
MVLSIGCVSDNKTDGKPDKIWDIYNDLTYESDDSFLASMKTKHPAEQRLVTWLRDNKEQAYYDYMQLLKSQTYSNGKILELTPSCYYVEGQTNSITQKDLIQQYYDKKIYPIPTLSPHGAATQFIESLANGSVSQPMQMTEGDFSKNFSTNEKQYEYWKSLSDGNLFARSIVRRVDITKDLLNAKVDLELLFFTPQNSKFDNIRLVRLQKNVEIKLNKDGTWLIQNLY